MSIIKHSEEHISLQNRKWTNKVTYSKPNDMEFF